MFLTTKKLIYLIFIFFCFFTNVQGQSTALSSESELIEKANALFESKDFQEAKPLFSQLLSLYPKEPSYNYKYGTCLLIAGDDREQALEYIQYAIAKGDIEDKAYFYLGKAYHMNYEFEKAIQAYKKYKDRAPISQENELEVDRHIKMCENGKSLLKKFKGIKVLQKQDMSLENFYRIYQMDGLKGQLLAKPEKFMSKADKKMNESSIMYFPENAKELYYSSYGDKAENGKDIYKVILLGNGKWSDPINLGNVINTAFDEDYVFVHPETQVMYFASNGHNSMGGYDLFKSSYDPEIANWTQVENLDFPYSTVDNDYMYVEVPGNPTAFFASDRFKTAGKTSVYKVNTIEVEPNIAVIKGKLSIEGMPEIQKATITIKDEAGNLVSKLETERDSKYEIAFNENGGSYVFNVETDDDSPIHSGKIELPENEGMNIYSQELVLKGDMENQTLVIKNDFEPMVGEAADISLSADVIKKQSELEVNSTEESLASTTDPMQENASTKEPATEQDPELDVEMHSKEDINNELLAIKNSNQKLLEKKSGLSESAYEKAKINSEKANELYLLAEQQSAPMVNSTMRSADQYALRAISFMEIASDLQNEISQLEENQDLIASADAEIANLLLNDNTQEAKNKIHKMQTSLHKVDEVDDGKPIPENVLQSLSVSERNLASLQSKLDELQEDKEEISENIGLLENESRNANSKRKEEIEISIRNYELDIKDVEFRMNLVNEDIRQAKAKLIENSFVAESWKEISNEPTTSSEANYSQEEKSAIQSEIILLEQNRKPSERLYTTASVSTEDDQIAENETIEQSKTDNPDQVDEGLSANQISKEQEEVSENLPDQDTSEDIEVKSPETFEQSPVASMDMNEEEKEIYSLPAAQQLITKAITLKQQSEQKYNAYNELLVSLRSLPTEEERTAAFERAHSLQEEARNLEIQAAVVRGNANKIQYLRNNAHLRSITDSPIPSANTNMILLIADEAAIHFEQAEVLRGELDTADRFSKKESNLIEALKYEEKALRKQEQALQLMDTRQEDLAMQEELNFDPQEAKAEANNLQQEYSNLSRLVGDLRKDAEREQNTQKRDSLLALADEKDSIAASKLIQANVLYVKSKETGGSLAYLENKKPQAIGIISKPDVIDSTTLASIDEGTKQAIVSSAQFIEYNKIYEEKEDLVRNTFAVYQKAKVNEQLRDSLLKKETELRAAALESESASEKVRLIQEAIVINSSVESLNSSLDSASKIIKLRNYLIAKKEDKLEQQLSTVQDKEKAEQMILMAKVVYEEKTAETDEQLPEVASLDLTESEGEGDQIESENILETNNETDAEISNEEDIASAEEETENTVDEFDTVNEEQEIAELPETDDNLDEPTEESDITVENETKEMDLTENNPEDVNLEVDDLGQDDLGEDNTAFIPREVENDVFEIRSKESRYNNTNPIPIDPVLPNGLVYQVQVGAFRNPIPQDHFQGFAPLMGVTAANGITRYTAGIFNDFPEADKAKDEIRKLGYSDAFVVAYMNGKRISVAEARNIQPSAMAEDDTTVEDVFSTEGNSQIKTETDQTLAESANAFEKEVELAEATDSKTVDGVYFSIQVGVFSKPLKKGELGYDGLLIVDKLPSGLYRYHIGMFDNLESAKNTHQNSISKDISDSFVVAYQNGKRIGLSQATAIISNR